VDALPVGTRQRCFQVLLVASIGLAAIQAAGLALSPPKIILSNMVIGVMGLLATGGCVCQAFLSKETRKLWLLLGFGFLLTSLGQLCSTYYEIQTGANFQSTAINPDFLYFAYGIPILLAVCSAGNDEGLKSLLWLDITQAVIATTLTYVQIFSALPAFGTQVPISAEQLMYLYNFENFILAGAVTLRLVSNSDPARQRFYRNLTAYLWVYAAIALVVGYSELKLHVPDGLQDIAWGVPYLVFVGMLTIGKEKARVSRPFSNRRKALSLLIDNLSPILFTLAIVLMGVTVAVVHKTLAFLCIAIAVLLYGIRATLLHGKYVKSREEQAKSAAELQSANNQLLALSIKDSLTGIYNRRHFDDVLLQEWGRSRRIKQPLSLLMIDVDHFKALNDRYGHQVGDECLCRIASEISMNLRRPDDIAARYGGEEFAVILPGADYEGAFALAEHIRISIECLSLSLTDLDIHQAVTVSIGISTEEDFSEAAPQSLIKEADSALYTAKSLGRNQCRTQREFQVRQF
jgi:diguanylate cyclase (GGDEF)-like protein